MTASPQPHHLSWCQIPSQFAEAQPQEQRPSHKCINFCVQTRLGGLTLRQTLGKVN